jgi:cobalamin transport system substrate-binding protein
VFLGDGAHRFIRIARRTLPRAAMAVLAIACSRDAARAGDGTPAQSAIEVRDGGGFTVRLAKPAQRIISLVPSATETLIAIGATPQIVGRTRFDVAPEIANLPSVGGGFDPSVETIVNLRPDLVISWASDKRQQFREKLIALGIPVFTLRTEDTTDIFHGIASIGRLAGRDSSATAVANSVRATLDSVRQSVSGHGTPSVLYVVYPDPPMTTGPRTFIGQLLSLAGGRSIFADATQNWPNVAMEEIVRRDPDLLIVPVGEFKSNSIDRFHGMAGWRDLRAVRTGHVVMVSADLMSRPSPGIAEAARVLRRALHPEVAGGRPDSSAMQAGAEARP